MNAEIGYRLRESLDRNGFHLNYDPEESVYRPWYRIPFRVDFENREGVARGNLFKRRINIPFGTALYSIDDDIASGLLHETGHIDILPVELPLFAYSLYLVADKIDDPIKETAAMMGMLFGYFLPREFIVEGYNSLKHGVKKYLKFRDYKRLTKRLSEPNKNHRNCCIKSWKLKKDFLMTQI